MKKVDITLLAQALKINPKSKKMKEPLYEIHDLLLNLESPQKKSEISIAKKPMRVVMQLASDFLKALSRLSTRQRAALNLDMLCSAEEISICEILKKSKQWLENQSGEERGNKKKGLPIGFYHCLFDIWLRFNRLKTRPKRKKQKNESIESMAYFAHLVCTFYELNHLDIGRLSILSNSKVNKASWGKLTRLADTYFSKSSDH